MKHKKMSIKFSIFFYLIILIAGWAYSEELQKIITITFSDGTKQRVQLSKQLSVTKIEFSTGVIPSAEKTPSIIIKPIKETKDETDFTQNTLVPLFQKLGFQNVKFKHGKKEYGKDIIFKRTTELGDFEYWAVQVKYGNVSGGATSKGGHKIDDIIKQIDDAFKMSFDNLDSKKEENISKLVVAISGKFSENATEKILKKIESHAAKNNVLFIDGTKIDDLIRSVQ